jgi:hypothetical protein
VTKTLKSSTRHRVLLNSCGALVWSHRASRKELIMKNRRFAIVVIIVMTVGQAFAGQVSNQPRWDYLQAKNRRFIDYQNDFKALMQSARECQEVTSIADLYERAETAAYSCLGARTLLYIYDEFSCQKTERAAMWSLIKKDLDWYAAHFDNSINAVNSDLVSGKHKESSGSSFWYPDERRPARDESFFRVASRELI